MLPCMKIKIEISDDLFKRAMKHAADEGIRLRDIVEIALRSFLSKPPNRTDYRLQWRTEHGRLLPGVDLDSRARLFDLISSSD